MWWLGFFFHEMAFGLLSVFLPLYVVKIGGSLVDIGIMTASALFMAIPSSFFWGYLCDRTRRYKRYILLSFLSLAIILYAFTLATSIELVIVLYVAMAIFHMAHEPPKNVLIAESFSHEEWRNAFSLYQTLTASGSLIGLLLGFTISIYGFAASSTLLLCSVLNVVAFVMTLFFVADPVLTIERGLLSIKKAVDFAYRGTIFATDIFDGRSTKKSLTEESLPLFCCGLAIFSLASGILFTPLPIFLSKDLALTTSVIFAVFILNSGGSVVGYFVSWLNSSRLDGKSHISKVVITRSILAFSLIFVLLVPTQNFALVVVILILLGLSYAFYLVFALLISMELIPKGKSGLFNVLDEVGGASGSFLGPFIAQTFGFTYVFLMAGALFLVAFVAFKTYARPS
jgi:MFS family permease